jgi:hypothetical protein
MWVIVSNLFKCHVTCSEDRALLLRYITTSRASKLISLQKTNEPRKYQTSIGWLENTCLCEGIVVRNVKYESSLWCHTTFQLLITPDHPAVLRTLES